VPTVPSSAFHADAVVGFAYFFVLSLYLCFNPNESDPVHGRV
jgi:hypothetical protein